MIQHFYANNINSLCCSPLEINNRISALTNEDLEEIKKLPSIVTYIEQILKEYNIDEPLQNEDFKVYLRSLTRLYIWFYTQ